MEGGHRKENTAMGEIGGADAIGGQDGGIRAPDLNLSNKQLDTSLMNAQQREANSSMRQPRPSANIRRSFFWMERLV